MFAPFDNWTTQRNLSGDNNINTDKWSEHNKKYLRKPKELMLVPVMETPTEDANITISTLPFR